MKIYLDVSCLNRPFDDQGQTRIRLESEAVTLILENCERGEWRHVSSEMAQIEIDAMPDSERRTRVQLLLPDAGNVLELKDDILARADELASLGFKPADSVHVAAAEFQSCDVLLTCDDRMLKVARRRRERLRVRVANPLEWLKENHYDVDP